MSGPDKQTAAGTAQKPSTAAAPASTAAMAAAIVRDLALAVLLGVAVGLVLGLIMFGLGCLAGEAGSRLVNGLNAARSGLMLVGAFMLLAGAVRFLKGDRLPEDTFSLAPLREIFRFRRNGSGNAPYPAENGAADNNAGVTYDDTDRHDSGNEADRDRKPLPIFRVLSRRLSIIAAGAGILLVSAVPDGILLSCFR